MSTRNFETARSFLKGQLPESSYVDAPEVCLKYAQDKSPGLSFVPDAVVFPKDVAEIQTVLRLANEYGFPVVTRGAGTGTVGGALAQLGGVVLSLEKWDRILEIDEDNRMAVVEPGIITGTLQTEVEKRGLFYPPDPASLADCTIGGNVATNAGGPRCLKYGVTGDYVVGLDAILPSGELVSFGGKLAKDVAGYDVKRLLVGSEGTFGVITKIILRLLPLPSHFRGLLVSFKAVNEAMAVLHKAIQLNHMPCAAEFMDRNCLLAISEYLNDPVPDEETTCQLMFLVDGFSDESVSRDILGIEQLCQSGGVLRIDQLDTPLKLEAMWTRRRQMSPALKVWGEDKVSFDVAVPPARIGDYLDALPDLESKFGATILGYGHLGDGNVHVNILKQSLGDLEWQSVKMDAGLAVCELAVSLGGTITGEHGVGIAKRHMMPLQFSDAELAVFRTVKSAFDPNGILNPEKILYNVDTTI